MYLRAMRDVTRCLGHSPDSATPEELRAFQLDMKERGVGASTFNNRLTVLSFFFATTCPRPEMKRHTRRFQTETASLFETRLRSIRLWLTISPWLIAAMVLTGIASMMAASFFWTVHLTRSELTELGLTRIERPEGAWLILDPSKTRLRTCTMGGRHVTCIQIEED